MKRGSRILLFLVLVIVILIAVAFLLLRPNLLPGSGAVTPTPASVSIVVVKQEIKRNSEVKADSLGTINYPLEQRTEKMVTDMDTVVGKYAAFDLPQGLPLTVDMVTDRPGANNGSPHARVIQPGMVAIAIPISRLNSVAYGVWDGDFVNVIATTMFVDLDSSYQSILPNNIGQIVNVGAKPDDSPLVTLGMNTGGIGSSRTGGRAELDPTLNQAVYLIPSEEQRPRLVSQTILQNVQVLHVGSFDTGASQNVQATPAPDAAGQAAATPAPVLGPDVITLIVHPQDAVALTYLIYGGAKLTLVLRAPDDNTTLAEAEAVTLQYLVSQYVIPAPAKLSYGFQPRIDILVEPILRNDIPTPRP